MDDLDRLAPLRAHFYLQRYDDVLQQYSSLQNLTPSLSLEAAAYAKRAQIALTYELKQPSTAAISIHDAFLNSILGLYEQYWRAESAQAAHETDALATQAVSLLGGAEGDDTTLSIAHAVVTILLMRCGRYEEAAKTIHPFIETSPEAYLISHFFFSSRIELI